MAGVREAAKIMTTHGWVQQGEKPVHHKHALHESAILPVRCSTSTMRMRGAVWGSHHWTSKSLEKGRGGWVLNHQNGVGLLVGTSGITHLVVFWEACLRAVRGSGGACMWGGGSVRVRGCNGVGWRGITLATCFLQPFVGTVVPLLTKAAAASTARGPGGGGVT